MDWMQIAIVVILILVFCSVFYINKKAQDTKPYEPNPALMEQGKAREARLLTWAEDPVAKSINWDEGVEGALARFRTHKIRYVGSSRVEFQPRHHLLGHIVIQLVAVGLAIFVYLETESIFQAFVVLLVGMGISVLGWLFLYLPLKPVVFDKRLGIFWQGRKQPDRVSGNPPSQWPGRIGDIYALQLIGAYDLSYSDIKNRSSLPDHVYPVSQIILVMKNGTRINAIAYRDSESFMKDSEALSRFLGKPLWNAL
jgi:hypothetical protein